MVANNGSISKAADELLISQPAVTQSIKILENQLGITLFVRTKKGVLLTDEGEVLYEYVREGMNYFVNGYNMVTSLKQLNSGVLKIGASTSVTEHFLMPYLSEFNKLYPNVEIKIVNLLTENLYKELRNGNIDIVIGGNIQENKDLEFNTIMEVSDIFVSKTELKCSVTELFNKKIIIQTIPSILRNNFNNFVREKNIVFFPYMEVISHRLVMELAKEGMGIGVVTYEYVLDSLKKGELYKVNVDIEIPKRKIGYVLLKKSVPSCRVRALIDLFNV